MRKTLESASDEVKLAKLADIYDNLTDARSLAPARQMLKKLKFGL